MGTRFVISVLLSVVVITGSGTGLVAGDRESGPYLAGIYQPQPPKGKGERCVANTDFMRRNHMYLLQHQRDDTVHEGTRSKRFSLKGCIDCHAVKGEMGAPVTIKDPKHFCRTCHDYAAVKVDCFECHTSRPAGKQAVSPAPDHDESKSLANFLEGLRQ